MLDVVNETLAGVVLVVGITTDEDWFDAERYPDEALDEDVEEDCEIMKSKYEKIFKAGIK